MEVLATERQEAQLRTVTLQRRMTLKTEGPVTTIVSLIVCPDPDTSLGASLPLALTGHQSSFHKQTLSLSLINSNYETQYLKKMILKHLLNN